MTAARCSPTAGIVDHHGAKVAPRKLGEMPPATQIYTIHTVVDGCSRPAVVRRGIGADQQQAPALPVTPRLGKAN